ncbi:MAG TPA: DUF5060 domain-containing protein [Opitutaceae bacterium]|jgi:hypothetical protein
MHVLRLAVLTGCIAVSAFAAEPGPIEFQFVVPESAIGNPYSREIWAEVTIPSGQKVAFPAYYADGGLYAVRVRPDEIGTYTFGTVSETTLGVRKSDMVVSLVTPAKVENKTRIRLPAIIIDPKDHKRFMRSDGIPYLPNGANLAWAPDGTTDRMAYYDRAFPAFAKANLNWMRIWMAHWDGLNLDWLPSDMGPSPQPGVLSEAVAENWDRLVADADNSGVYIQLVLQYHGQYTTANDSNWAQNPWNAANRGGFLKEPDDFFTDANARIMTLVKYRYIVARWGWSPAIVAWELFNEVHWTDAYRNGHEAEVGRWHSEIAKFLRSIDAYGHLITTSTDDLRSPIYEQMDYYQPHLYATNMIAGARSFDPAYASLTKPAFYGEAGDDHEPLSEAQKKAGLAIVPPVWASLMGQGEYPCQPWDGWRLVEQNRLGELGGVLRFLAINRVTLQANLLPFSVPVECAEKVPLKILAGQSWQRRAAPDFTFPLDGSVPMEAADVPSTLVSPEESIAHGFPSKATYHFDFPAPTKLTVHVGKIGDGVAGLRLTLDGQIAATQRWPGGAPPKPNQFTVPVSAGKHTLVVEGPGPEWVEVPEIDLGMQTSALALIGRRNAHFIEAWVWSRRNLYATNPSAPVSGTVDLDNVAAGTWKVTWWDTTTGEPGPSKVIDHPGGPLKLPTPPIVRDAAVALVREL